VADFYQALAAVYEDVFPLNPGQVQFVLEQLPQAPQPVVDLGCSTGALARKLAEAGYDVLGIDLSENMIAQAQQAAASQAYRGSVEFKVADMRQVAATTQAAGALLCLGNTLVHLTAADQLAQFLRSCNQALQGDGPFIGQIVNYDRVAVQQVTQLPTLQGKRGNQLQRFYHPREDGLLDFATTLILSDGTEIDSTVTLRPLLRQQLAQSLQGAGFSNVRWFGSYQGEAWSEGTFHTIFVASK
jgi:glycine/sarcosine N-methyltransferase